MNADSIFNPFEQFGNLHPIVVEFAVWCQRLFDSEVFVLLFIYFLLYLKKILGCFPRQLGTAHQPLLESHTPWWNVEVQLLML